MGPVQGRRKHGDVRQHTTQRQTCPPWHVKKPEWKIEKEASFLREVIMVATGIMNTRIESLEQAKAYFVYMGCSGFHIAREDFQRRDEYYSFNISKETEEKWASEHIVDIHRHFMEDSGNQEAWAMNRFINLVEYYPTEKHMNHLIEAIEEYRSKIKTSDKILIAGSIESRREVFSGIIKKAVDLNLYKEAMVLSKIARQMVLEAIEEERAEADYGNRLINKLDIIIDEISNGKGPSNFRKSINKLFHKITK